MFERRLKIFLLLLGVMVLGLVVRAGQIQLWGAQHWRDRAAAVMKRAQLTETVRGRILDVRGREVALDDACIDLCVDYRAIPREADDDWVRELARRRLSKQDRYRSAPAEERRQMLATEIALVRTQLEVMWHRIARLSNKPLEEIDDIRRAIVRRVEMRRRYIWYKNYEKELNRFNRREPGPWYRQWLLDDSAEAPKLDSFMVTVAEETEPHVIIRDFVDKNNELGKEIEDYPGLILRPSRHRVYPYREIGAHLLGNLAAVNRQDLQADPNQDDELRQYLPNDLIGRGGIEGLCEQALRGSRGSLEREAGREEITQRIEPVSGRDVHLTIDMDLQADIQHAFAIRREYVHRDGTLDEVREHQHGAAVVIDVASGQIRALVSYPSFDPNQLEELYPKLLGDDLNKPLMNRATQAQYPPGSTVKTIVGLGGLTHGYIRPEEGIECTGYLVINGHAYHDQFRCWVSRQYESMLGRNGVAHHPVPEPHPTGFLTITDALERSCNVVFETLADRMGLVEVSDWMNRFGLGRPTGIGIPEASGRIPQINRIPRALLKWATWSAGIGQGEVSATPLQMANVAATIARQGIWLRPRLVREADAIRPSSQPVEERVDLKLAPSALAAVREGMEKVVNSRAGTGQGLRRSDGMVVAGKTGSAQTGRLSIPKRDASGQRVIEAGRQVFQPVELGTPGTETWYMGVGSEKKDLAHAWILGYAPADRPQVAFCVLVEYGGSGGKVAADIAQDVLDACVAHGYLSLGR